MVLSSVRQPAELPADSPEGVVQRYLRAVADGDRDAVWETYSQEMRERCDEAAFTRPPRFDDDRPSFRAELVSTREVPDGVEVHVRITEFSGEPPFSDGGYDHRERFTVEREGDSWLLSEASWPYYGCRP